MLLSVPKESAYLILKQIHRQLLNLERLELSGSMLDKCAPDCILVLRVLVDSQH